jgi:hypothetical protein
MTYGSRIAGGFLRDWHCAFVIVHVTCFCARNTKFNNGILSKKERKKENTHRGRLISPAKSEDSLPSPRSRRIKTNEASINRHIDVEGHAGQAKVRVAYRAQYLQRESHGKFDSYQILPPRCSSIVAATVSSTESPPIQE